MFSRFSVKKPFVILVGVIVVMLLGAVSITRMPTNLMPDMDIPYLAVITTEPGASPEKIEADVTEPLEAALGVVSGVQAVQSQSSENYSMIFLEFAEDTNMDSAMVKVSAALNTAKSTMPDEVNTPNIMEISMDSMATLYSAVSYEGKDIYETSDFTEDTLIPYLERQEGVADVSPTGIVTDSVEVRLSQSKIDDINNKLLAKVNDKLYDAKKELDEGRDKLTDAQNELNNQQSTLDSSQSQTAEQLGQGDSGLTMAISATTSQITTLSAQAASVQAALQQTTDPSQVAALTAQLSQLQDQITKLQGTLTDYQTQLSQVQSGSVNASAQFGSMSAQLASAKSTLEQNAAQLDSAEEQYENTREEAIKSANIDQLVSMDTLAQLVAAQDFAMPAGYVSDDASKQWMVRIGQEYTSVDELSNMILTNIDGVGDIRLSDVADITVIDDAAESYAKVNGNPGVVLSVFKTSTASTSDVSKKINAAYDQLEKDHPGLQIENLMDQGEYIDQFISTILTSLLIGSLLAVVVLALFLRGVAPTLVVAFSIPFSVLVALLAMYFSGITLNIMSLGALSLAIGMLVDNSVVVLENIYRLRGRGLSSPRAAVQGAKQVSGAILSSSLTTICVFLPLIFTTGLTRQMMLPFALTISFSLLASLLVALTVVPSISSFILKKNQPKDYRWFVHLQDAYEKALNWCLRFKAVPLALAIVLLCVSGYALTTTGITLIPEMSSKQVSATVTMPDGTSDQDSYAKADEVMQKMLSVEGVASVGAMDAAGASSMGGMGAGAAGSAAHLEYYFYALPDDSVTTDPQIKDLTKRLEDATEDMGCEVVVAASAMGDVSSMLGSGLQIDIAGEDLEEINRISQDIMGIVGQVEGYTEIENGQEESDPEINIVVDKDEAMRLNMTVAQLYGELSKRLVDDKTATSMKLDGKDMEVVVVDSNNKLTKENLMDMTFDVKVTDKDGNQVTETHKLSDIAHTEERSGYTTITRVDGSHQMSVTAQVEDGYNNALLARDLQTKIDAYDVPNGYSVSMGGEVDNINEVLFQMMLLISLGFLLVYLVMVAQFQSLLSPFIIIFTVPLAFTGGMLALLFAGEQLTLMSGMGFVVLMGTVVNNGIVFVDYVNQLRIGGMNKHDALLAAGRTRMRPIFMTALTTILAMSAMIFSQEIGASMQRGMALVVAGGLTYATLMTLFVVPVVYDIMYRKNPHQVDLGSEDYDDSPDDAADFIAHMKQGAQGSGNECEVATNAGEGFTAVNPAKPLNG